MDYKKSGDQLLFMENKATPLASIKIEKPDSNLTLTQNITLPRKYIKFINVMKLKPDYHLLPYINFGCTDGGLRLVIH